MFRIHETKGGLLIPGFMLDKYEDGRSPLDQAPSSLSMDKTNNKDKNRRNSEAQGKGQHRNTNKKSDDRQLQLFYDD